MILYAMSTGRLNNIISILLFDFIFLFFSLANSFHFKHTYTITTRTPLKATLTTKVRTATTIIFFSHKNDLYDDEDSRGERSVDKEKDIKSILLWISYDGGRFTGWSAQNNETTDEKKKKGFVRSIQFALKSRLARVYGNVDPSQIVVEGTSRTDKGVHAKMMIAQIYGLKKTTGGWNTTAFDNNDYYYYGKRLPHPRDAYFFQNNTLDHHYFLPVPMNPSKLVYVLNRMLPDDISIRGYQLPPSPNKYQLPFHPSHNATSKTYNYTFSIGPIHDPTQWRKTWYVGNPRQWNVTRLKEACRLLEGRNYNYIKYRGSPRGKNDIFRFASQDTNCTLTRITVENITSSSIIPGLTTYCISITGDRFLYKMVRFLVGSLVAVGQQKITMDDFKRTVFIPTSNTNADSPNDNNDHGPYSYTNREKLSECAPANGLSLVNITFGHHPYLQHHLSWKA